MAAMSTSQNGWPASPSLLTRGIVVDGVPFRVADNRDVETVLIYVITRYAATVEPLDVHQCGSFNYRPNKNNPSKLSNHSSATAVDLNSLKHPNGVTVTHAFTAAQIRACHAILASVPELSEVVHWGGDWFPPLTPDGMHWELHDHDLPKLARVAERIRGEDVTPEDIEATAKRAAELVLNAKVGNDDTTLKQALNKILTKVERL